MTVSVALFSRKTIIPYSRIELSEVFPWRWSMGPLASALGTLGKRWVNSHATPSEGDEVDMAI